MARLPALLEAIAKVDGRERATIDHYARLIREAGLIPTTKRGVGASAMTVREAANLLIGLNAAETPKDAPSSVIRVRSLLANAGFVARWLRQSEWSPVFEGLREARTFGDALERLIDATPALLLFGLWGVRQVSENEKQFAFHRENLPGGHGLLTCFVEVTPSYCEIRIDARWLNNSQVFSARYLPDVDQVECDERAGRFPVDRRVTVRFGLPTLIACLHAIYPETDIGSGGLPHGASVDEEMR